MYVEFTQYILKIKLIMFLFYYFILLFYFIIFLIKMLLYSVLYQLIKLNKIKWNQSRTPKKSK